MRAIVTAALLCLPACPATAGPDGDALARIGAGSRLAVGVPAGATPAAGFGRDLFAALAAGMGADVTWVEVAPGRALPDLDAGRFDVAAGPFPAAEGARPGRLALPPVAGEGDALLKRRGDGSVLKPADAAGKAVGLVGTASGLARVRAAVLALRARPTVHAASPVDPRDDLAAGRLAAVAGTLPDVTAAALARPAAFELVGPLFGTVTRLAPVARADPDHARLAEALRAGLAAMRADGRLAALQRRWFGLAFDAPAGGPPQSL